MAQTEWDLVRDEIRVQHLGNRTWSAALLAWFLNAVWRIDEPAVDNAICDGPNDRGVDALVVDDDLREITIFQCKYYERADRAEGNSGLERLVGAAANFESPEAVDALLAAGPNPELQRLIRRNEVRTKVADGAHVAQAIFITNGVFDANARAYAQGMAARRIALDLWDAPRLAALAERTRRPDLRPEAVRLVCATIPTLISLDPTVDIALALVPASELIQLPGIDDRTLFARNVRLGIGGTRVNRELAEAVRESEEHAFFPAYHNGMTLLTKGIVIEGSTLVLDGVSVVNGCQSLLALHGNRASVTDRLRLLVKVVQVDPQSDLADQITYRTNNQNLVDIRDQRSTDAIQRDLQRQVAERLGPGFAYSIRAGERLAATEVLDNALAAQLLMAVYVGEPWNAVRKVRLFDEDYHRIFNHTLTAGRLQLVYEVAKLLDSARSDLVPQLQASFASVRFTLAYLVSRVLRDTAQAGALLDEPDRWLPERLAEVREAISPVVDDVIDAVNFYVEEKNSPVDDEDGAETREDFDPKVAFKSRAGVRELETAVLRSIRADARRARRREDRRGDDLAFGVAPMR